MDRMTIRAHGAAKVVAGCLFAITAVLSTTGLTVANSSASPGSSCATGTPSPSPPPTPPSTPSPSASPGQVSLCEQVTHTGPDVSPGGSTPFTIEVSATGGPASDVVVTLSGTPSGVTPRFTRCPAPPTGTKNTATSCTISSLNGTQEFDAALYAPASAANGETVTLNPQATAANPNLKVNTWAPATVMKSGSTGTGNGGGQANTGSGVNHGAGTTGSSSGGSPNGSAGSAGSGSQGAGGAGGTPASAGAVALDTPLTSSAGPVENLPLINGSPARGGGDISTQLPSIPPGGTASAARPAGYRASPSGPLSRKMLGTQLLGLAALCAAVGIVLTRFWRHKPGAATGTGAGGAQDLAPARGPRGWRRFLPGRLPWSRPMPR
jgi:hypothetical protein